MNGGGSGQVLAADDGGAVGADGDMRVWSRLLEAPVAQQDQPQEPWWY